MRKLYSETSGTLNNNTKRLVYNNTCRIIGSDVKNATDHFLVAFDALTLMITHDKNKVSYALTRNLQTLKISKINSRCNG